MTRLNPANPSGGIPIRYRILLPAIAVLAPLPAHAQVFVDVFAGRSMPESTAATIRADEAEVNGTLVPAQVRVDIASLKPSGSTIYGARIGHWFGWFGVALDAATLDPDIKRQTIRASANVRFDEQVFGEQVVIERGEAVNVAIPRLTVPTTATIAALAMVRLPGRAIEPYAFAGPAYVITDTDLTGAWGVRAGAGAKVPLSRHFALFGEYRYTGVSNARAVAGSFGGSMQGVSATTNDIRVGLDLRNHSAVGGVSVTF